MWNYSKTSASLVNPCVCVMFSKLVTTAKCGVRSFSSIKERTAANIIGTYARYDITLSHGQGSYLYDVAGKKYLDFGGGPFGKPIAIIGCSLDSLKKSS